MALTDYQLITSTDSGALSRVVLKQAAEGFLPLGAPFTSPKGEYAQVLVKGDVAGGGGGSAPASVAAADITDATDTGIALMTAANQAAAAAAVLPAGTNGQVLKHNGTTWAAGADTNTVYTLPAATDAVLGGIKLGSGTVQTVAAAAVTATAARTYAVQVTAAGQAVVNVPWSDTNTVYTLTAATTAALGGVKQGTAVADAVADSELTTLNALLAALRTAGIIAQ